MIRRQNSILVEIIRPEGYEDVCDDLVLEDFVSTNPLDFEPIIFKGEHE